MSYVDHLRRANKVRRMLFHLKQSFVALIPNIVLPLHNILSGHTLNMLFKHPIPQRRGIGKCAKARERVSVLPVRSSSPTAWTILFYTLANPW